MTVRTWFRAMRAAEFEHDSARVMRCMALADAIYRQFNVDPRDLEPLSHNSWIVMVRPSEWAKYDNAEADAASAVRALLKEEGCYIPSKEELGHMLILAASGKTNSLGLSVRFVKEWDVVKP